jgi:Secretion system C-terminal sorting domain
VTELGKPTPYFIYDMDVTHTGVIHSDFTLVNTDAIDDIFNGIEVDIVRQSGFTDIPQIEGENRQIDDVQIYPNPAQSIVNIRSTDPVKSVELCDISGKTILRQQNLFENSVDISSIQNGLYFLKIAFEDRVIVKKITKN